MQIILLEDSIINRISIQLIKRFSMQITLPEDSILNRISIQ
jgi:hypothetical protein